MDTRALILRAGGIARYCDLRDVMSRAELAAAVRTGALIRVGHGRYSLPDADVHMSAAASLSGVLAGLSAAMFWGWKVKLPPERPQVIVPRGRTVASSRRQGVDVRWADIAPEDRERGVLGQVATALDCARTLPFDAALAVMDSALRDGVPRTSLLRGCARLPRTGRSRAIRVVELADRRADNPFESVLRAELMDLPGTHFVPQVWVGNVGRADLVDVERRLVVEADSFEFHSSREALLRDIERYNGFAAEGYTLLRFGWEHAMFQPDYVREAVTGVVATFGLSVRAPDYADERGRYAS